MIGGIISAGIGLVGSLFGKKEKTTTESTVNYAKMVKDSAAAGFNPLTAIRNGGSAGFTTSTTTAPTASQLPGALSALGGALGNAYDNKFDPLKVKERQRDTALVDYQLRQLKQLPTAALQAPGTFTGTKVRTSSATVGAAARKVASYVDESRPTNTDPWLWTGGVIEADPNRTDGAAYEDAYGDFIGGLTGGVVPPVQDIIHNARRGFSAAQDVWKRYRSGEFRKPPPEGYRYAR